MELSSRIAKLSPSPTVALNAKAKALRAEGRTILNFAVGEPDFATPQAIVNVGQAALAAGKTKYGPAGGSPAFRQALSEKLKNENGLNYAADQIVVGIGAKEVLFHAFLAILNDGDEVLVPAPYWVSYSEQIKAAGAVPVIVPPPTNFPEEAFSVEQLAKHVSDKTRAIVLTSPSNPAGYVLDEATLKELGTLIQKHPNWWVIADEIYEYLAFDKPHHSLLKLCPDLQERFLYVNGLSKGFAMTGWRVGYVAGPAPAIKLIKGLQSHSSTCLPPFIEEAALYAVQQGPSMMKEAIAKLKDRRDLAVSLLNDIPEVGFVRPEGAFYAYIDVRAVLAKSSQFANEDTLAFCEWLLMEYGLAVVPGEAFGTPGFFRLSYATSEDDIKSGLAKLKQAIATLEQA